MSSFDKLPRILRSTAKISLLTIACFCVLPGHANAGNTDSDILGTWKLTKVLDSADVASMDEHGAAALLGKTLVVRRDSVSFAGEPCRAPELTRHREPTAQYVREGYHARVGMLGLPEHVTVIDLQCTEALFKGKGKIVVFWDGFFFDAVKQPSGRR
jgi:hypothetical protein